MTRDNEVVVYDALKYLAGFADGSVDAIITDPPYNTTDLIFDKGVRINWVSLWSELSRVISRKGAICITAQNPFASELILGNRKMFRYEWVWEKTIAPSFVNAACQPLRTHELILVFSHSLHVNGAHKDRLMNYYPQMTTGEPYSKFIQREGRVNHYHGVLRQSSIKNTGERYPRSVMKISNNNNASLHPTQKPLDLMTYLVRTYTRPDELVLDPFAGSGSTLVAARNTGRRYAGCDLSPEYVAIAQRRLSEPFTAQMFTDEPTDTEPDATQTDMFEGWGEGGG